jgi:hypothetical protein
LDVDSEGCEQFLGLAVLGRFSAQNAGDLPSHVVGAAAASKEQLRRRAFEAQGDEDVFGADIRVVQGPGLLNCTFEDLAGRQVETLEHGSVPPLPIAAVLLVDRLAADPEVLRDVLPRPAVRSGVADVEHLELLHQGPQRRHRRQADRRVQAVHIIGQHRHLLHGVTLG